MITKDILQKFCADLFKTDIEVEFLVDEIELVNEFIVDNDYRSFIDFIKDKKVMTKEIEKESILNNIKNLWQFVMDQAYELWDSELGYSEFLEKLTPYEKIAVQFGKFNQQVENNGIYGWHDNGYSVDCYDLTNFLENSDFPRREQFLNVIETFNYVQEQIKKLDRFDEFYESDCNTRYEYLKGSEKDYISIKDSWINYFQNYLFDNLPKEYLEKIKEYNLSKVNI